MRNPIIGTAILYIEPRHSSALPAARHHWGRRSHPIIDTTILRIKYGSIRGQETNQCRGGFNPIVEAAVLRIDRHYWIALPWGSKRFPLGSLHTCRVGL